MVWCLFLFFLSVEGSMGLVQLPPYLSRTLDVVDYSAAEQIQNTLYHKFNIEVGDYFILSILVSTSKPWMYTLHFYSRQYTYMYTPHIICILKWYETPQYFEWYLHKAVFSSYTNSWNQFGFGTPSMEFCTIHMHWGWGVQGFYFHNDTLLDSWDI